MNHIDQTFAALKEQGKTALMPFLTVGDPDAQTTIEIIRKLEEAGADILELGVPYSDPLADGPVIQRASGRALEHGITITECIQVAADARAAGVKLPFILFTYYNPVFQLGLKPFFELLRGKGISGLIIPDLPLEEDEELRAMAEQENIHLIPLVAPTSRERIAQITGRARGFIYCVSSLGVTGVRSDFHAGIDSFLNDVRQSTDLPIAIGFGISSREHVERFSQQCDGVVVGSAIVKRIEEALPLLESPDQREQGLEQIREFVQELKSGA